ncbi:MAG: hypothetical protein SVT52_00235, partial [Planctomycetota bacterium]|nr:hypothetical protein [Planctomycetota bacterium]
DCVHLLPIIFFLGLSVSVALVAHWRWKNFFGAGVLSGLIVPFLHMGIGVLVEGYLDPFFLMVLPVGWVFSSLIAFAVGLGFVIGRRRHR